MKPPRNEREANSQWADTIPTQPAPLSYRRPSTDIPRIVARGLVAVVGVIALVSAVISAFQGQA